MNQILFEKLVLKSDVSTEEMIACSEKRRSMIDNMEKDVFNYVNTYYDAYVQMMSKLGDCHLAHQPLFQWNSKGSSCWLYEKIHLEDLMMTTLWKDALKETDLKKRRQLLQRSISCGVDALGTLSKYHWEDTSITSMDKMQDRYYLYHLCKAAAQYYKTMNQFSIDTKSVSNSKCVRMAFEYMDVACNVWKSDKYDREERDIMHAQYLLSVAQQMEDDKCGEKVALLKDVVEKKATPPTVVSEYNIWKQQNEQVYYQKEETDFKITYSSLQDLFQNLQTIVSSK